MKCDIRKFFANIDHSILKAILAKYINDSDILVLFGQVIDSFHTTGKSGVGLPLGNLTSQLLVNVYMNEFDQFVKRVLQVKYYIRYADDFVVLHENREYLDNLTPEFSRFLMDKLRLSLHPDKVYVTTLSSGLDFLGWVHFPKHRVLRTTTKKRMFRNLENNARTESVNSYIGLLSHGNTYKLSSKIKKRYPN